MNQRLKLIQNGYLCDQIDDFIVDKPFWVATLSNGVNVYQDDYRQGLEPPQAWLRLKDYCFALKLNIKAIRLRFRSHWINPVPNNCLLYSFIKSLVNINITKNINCYSFGYLTQELKFNIIRWMVPELELESVNEANLLSHKDLFIFGEAWQKNDLIHPNIKADILQALGLPQHNI